MDEERKQEVQDMIKFASGMDEEKRMQEHQKVMREELNITDYTVEPEMEQVLTDFYIKPYP